MSRYNSFLDLLKEWPCAELADELGVSIWAVYEMRRRRRVAIHHWPTLIAAARKRGITLTEADLTRLYNVGNNHKERAA
jgi:hypothetical protein